jgi:hypothetical protein
MNSNIGQIYVYNYEASSSTIGRNSLRSYNLFERDRNEFWQTETISETWQQLIVICISDERLHVTSLVV